ncbi:unnamed protein product [Ascophyllum nodosum]
MKRGSTDGGGGVSPGHPAKLQKTANEQGRNSDGDNSGRDDKSLLQQRNYELAVDMRRRKRQEVELEKKLAQAWSKQGHFDATLSAVNRAWNQVLSDLEAAAGELGLGPRPLKVNVKQEEGELEVTVKDGLAGKDTRLASPFMSGKPTSELSIMEKLLLPAAEVLAMDATDSSSADQVLKDMGKKLPNEGEEESPRELLGCMAGTSGALCDLDSDGYGLQSREGVKVEGAAEISEVERSLQEKARFTAELGGRLFQALQAQLMSLPPEARRQTLDRTHADMMAEKKKLLNERAFLSDQLTMARIRCNELSDSLTTLREDHRKVNRTLDKLAADGVELPSDNNLASAWGGRTGSSNVKTEGEGQTTEERLTSIDHSHLGGTGSPADLQGLMAALEEARALSETRQKEIERCRAEKEEAEIQVTEMKATTLLDTGRADLSGHPQFQRLSSRLEAEQGMLKLEKTRVAQLEKHIKNMAAQQVEQHEIALQVQMEQQRLRWKSEIVSTNGMLNAAHEELEKTQAKLKHEKSVGTGMLVTVAAVRDETEHLLAQTEQQVSILKASLDRATKAKEQAEVQAAKDRARLQRQGTGGIGSRDDESLKVKLQNALRQLEASKAVEDALQSELNTTLAAYAQSKEGNQKLIQEVTRISASQQELSDELAAAKQQLKNRAQVRATMELQVKTAAQMRDQGHALKQKAEELVTSAEERLQKERTRNIELSREVYTGKAHTESARQQVDSLTRTKQVMETTHSSLKEHCKRLNEKATKLEKELENCKEQVATLTRKLEKSRNHSAKLLEQIQESAITLPEEKVEDNEMRDAELAELRKMIKCSVCQDKKKNRVITKCFHMFCDGCLEQSIKSRNRKCPACTKAYGSDDVHELWLT